MNGVIAMNAMVTLLLAALWNRSDGKNVAVKLAMWLVFAINAFVMLKASGYIVKVTP